jgi:hypothetical protein
MTKLLTPWLLRRRCPHTRLTPTIHTQRALSNTLVTLATSLPARAGANANVALAIVRPAITTSRARKKTRANGARISIQTTQLRTVFV